MKKTRRIDVLRGIRANLNRFLSIMFIVALGAGFLSGLMATTPDMEDAADGYMDDTRFFDIDVRAMLGLTEEDAAAIAEASGIDETCPAYVRDAVLNAGDGHSFTARIFGFLEQNGENGLNRLAVLEGEPPSAPDECLIQAPNEYADGLPKVGDTLRLDAPDDGVFAYNELKVSGIARGPMFISAEPEASAVGSGSITLGVYVPRGFYSLNEYTDVYATVEGALELGAYSDEYASLIALALDALAPVAEECAGISAGKAREEAQAKLDGLEKLAGALEAASEAKRALESDIEARLSQSESVYAKLRDKQTPAAQAIAAMNARLGAGEGSSHAGAIPLAAEARSRLEDARASIDAITELGEWQLRTREENAGFASYRDNSEKVAALCAVFPAFFFAVAMLVALTTMTRLVDESRARIGTLKSLGFSDGQVLAEYLLFSLLASALGCALGFAVGFRVFPRVISGAYGMMYTLPPVETPFRWGIAAPVALLAIGGTLLATLFACYEATRLKPAALMTPRAPRAGKRVWAEKIPWLWNRLSFTWKVTVRNLFRYKKRLYMSIFGVMGCSALLVAGFGLRDSIHDIVSKQFGEIYKYNLMAVMTEEGAEVTDASLAALLADEAVTGDYLAYMSQSGSALFSGRAKKVTLSVPSDAARLTDFITLRERKSGRPTPINDEGVLLNEKLCEELGVKAGDEITLENAAGKRARVTVGGVIENYIAASAYLSPTLYESLFHEAPEYRELLVRLSGDALRDAERVLACPKVVYTFSTESIKETFAESVKSIDAIVAVLIVAAGMLSMVVLYNLINVNLCERRKELATIRVLGFHHKEVEQYVFREIYVLSAAGTLLGLVAGIWLHGFVVRTVEINAVMFGRDIKWASFVYAAGISLAFTWLVNRLMRRGVDGVDMVESMKAND